METQHQKKAMETYISLHSSTNTENDILDIQTMPMSLNHIEMYTKKTSQTPGDFKKVHYSGKSNSSRRQTSLAKKKERPIGHG